MNTYSRGYCWYYWEYYKKKAEPTRLECLLNQSHFANDSTPKKLYVTKKCSSYKEELLHHFSYNKYKQLILNKAIKKMNTTVAKGMYSKGNKPMREMGSWSQKPITTEHLMSVIAYCDLDAYSTKFSSTFRKLKPEETFQSVKQRNREYWWQSKLLKEVVTCYGSSSHINIGAMEKEFILREEAKYQIQRMNTVAESGPFCMFLFFPSSVLCDLILRIDYKIPG